MPRARSPARDKAKDIWLASGKQKKLKDIATGLNVSESQIRQWKNKDKWEASTKPNNNVTNGSKDNVTFDNEMNSNVINHVSNEIVIENDELTDKQKLFCYYYVKYWNATKAYQKAYDCNRATAMASGSRLLRNVNVSREIDRLKEELFSGTRLDSKTFAKALLQKHIDIAFADITDFLSFGRKEIVTSDGDTREVNFVHLKRSDEVDGTLINEIKEGREGVSIKLANREKSLDFLTKHYDLLGDEDKQTLQTAKLYYEVAKAKKEADTVNNSSGEQVVFVNSEDEMAAYIAEHGDTNVQSR